MSEDVAIAAAAPTAEVTIDYAGWFEHEASQLHDFIDSIWQGVDHDISVELHNAKTAISTAVSWVKRHLGV